MNNIVKKVLEQDFKSRVNDYSKNPDYYLFSYHFIKLNVL